MHALLLLLAAAAGASEQEQARRFVAAKFEGRAPAQDRRAGLAVIENHERVQIDARAGGKLQIAGKEYERGLYCHALSKLIVRLPGPGRLFRAVVGVDGHAGGGSIVFSASVPGKEPLRTPVMHVEDAGRALELELGGARELVLEVGDAGDGISCDQADWADARVLLESGAELALGDLPLLEDAGEPFTTEPPFSFVYGGRPSSTLLAGWKLERSARELDPRRTERTLRYSDPATALEVRCVAVEYHDFPVVEWTLHLRNAGATNTPILADVLALDTRFSRTRQGEFVLQHPAGTRVDRSDYQPQATTLGPGQKLQLTPSDGRPCASAFPYFNLEWPGAGVIAAIGWPGKWTAEFARDDSTGLRISAGQEGTHFELLPGEEVRTPLVVLQFWKGDALGSQNLWRRWMIAHNLPRCAGELPRPQMPAVSGNQFPGQITNERDEELYIDRYREEAIPVTHWWLDAGWYRNQGSWQTTGTWEVDEQRYPHGLRGVADHAHEKGLGFIVWFEPERVSAGSWLAEQHPEWVLGGKAGGLLNLGNRAAWSWLVERYDQLITQSGIDWYRQDFNMDPLPFWRANDAPDRQGITEIRHVEGYLAFWDELLRRHPQLRIDSCASGGHRNDLETLRRSVPLLRSDFILDPIGEQCHTYGLASWIPYWGTGFIDFDAYIFRGCMGLSTTLSCDARRKDLDWNLLRKLTAQWQRVAPDFYGDYYPLTPYSLENDVWMAWQFDRPETGEGLVQVFRRGDSPYEAARFKLHGLDARASYEVTDLDQEKPQRMSGQELLEQGLPIALTDRPGSAVISYRLVR
jgi:alpha-galactosidase